MPDGCALQEHFLSIAKRIATLGTPRARRMKMIVFSSLQDFARDKSEAVGALHPKQVLIAFFAVGSSVFAHIFPMQKFTAGFAFETPDMVMLVQSH